MSLRIKIYTVLVEAMLFSVQVLGQSQVTDEMIEEALARTKIQGAISGAQMYKGTYLTPFETTAKPYRIYQRRILSDNVKSEWRNTEDYLSINFDEKYISVFGGRDEINAYDSWARTYYVGENSLSKGATEVFAIDDNGLKVIIKITCGDTFNITISTSDYKIQYKLRPLSNEEIEKGRK